VVSGNSLAVLYQDLGEGGWRKKEERWQACCSGEREGV